MLRRTPFSAAADRRRTVATTPPLVIGGRADYLDEYGPQGGSAPAIEAAYPNQPPPMKMGED